jgi:hypothetical protein
VPVLNIFSGKKLSKKQTFSQKLCGGKYFGENFSKKPVFSPACSLKSARNSCHQTIFTKWSLCFTCFWQILLFSKKLRKNLYLCKLYKKFRHVSSLYKRMFRNIFAKKRKRIFFSILSEWFSGFLESGWIQRSGIKQCWQGLTDPAYSLYISWVFFQIFPTLPDKNISCMTLTCT